MQVEQAAVLQNPLRLFQRQVRMGKMLKDEIGHHDIEDLGCEGQSGAISLQKSVPARQRVQSGRNIPVDRDNRGLRSR